MTTIEIPDGIAVIGMSCRFPGAGNIDEFWKNLKNGVESITHFSDEDLIEAGIDSSVFNQSEYVRKGFVIDDEDLFDASFFGYSPREAELMDPQQRLFLETAWKTFEDAGYSPLEYKGSVGVFAGSKISTYLLAYLNGHPLSSTIAGFQTLLGNDKDYLATRVSYKLNLEGPSVAIQSACSTSLVAVHIACENLLSGACDMALAGAAALIVPQKAGYLYQEGMVLSPDGHCCAFDSNARGMSPGNGVGAVLLKRLEDALEDKDCIHAVIRGSAVNNDGSHKIGYTTPSVDGQAKVIREAIAIAGVPAESISYIETHGTGTPLGDPVEIEALNKVFKSETGKKGFCAIGSVKPNIGHLDTVAGVASLIKTVLSLKNSQVPASLNYVHPNPKINFQDSPFFVNSQLSEWEKNGFPKRAGVSSFGFGGTNAHVILEEAPERSSLTQRHTLPLHLMTLSAKTPDALKQQIKTYYLFLEKNTNLSIDDICFTSNTGRSHFQYRFAGIATSTDDLCSQLLAATTDETSSTLFKGIVDDLIKPEVSFDLSEQFFESNQFTVICSDSHVLKSHYRLSLSMKASKDDYRLILTALGKLYVRGANIDWGFFYRNCNPYRIPLPTYPFEGKKHWIENKHGLADAISLVEAPNGSAMPFMGRQVSCPNPVFQFELSLSAHPFLKAHRIHGEIVIPVGVFWEMALAAGNIYFKSETVLLKNITQHEAMLISENQPSLKIQLVLDPKDSNHQNSEFIIFCKEESSDQSMENWRKYVSGTISVETETVSEATISFEEVKNTCKHAYHISQFIEDLYALDAITGDDGKSPWQFQEIWTSDRDALAKITFSDTFLSEVNTCQFHPSIFEPCLQTMLAIPLNQKDDAVRDKISLPIGFDTINYSSTMSETVWCHVAIRPGKNWRNSDFIVDFQLFTQQGEVVAQMLGAYMRQALASTFLRDAEKSLCYRIYWQKLDTEKLFKNPSRSSSPGCWLILGDPGGSAEKLVQYIQADGSTWIMLLSDGNLHIHTEYRDFKEKIAVDAISSQETFEFIFKEKLPEHGLHCTGVIQCWGSKPPTSDDLTSEELKDSVFFAYSSTVYLLRALVSSGHDVDDFCLLTQGAQAVTESDLISVVQTPLWGMQKCLEREHPAMNVHIFDLGWSNSSSQFRTLWEILRLGTNEKEIAFRDEDLYAPRLMPLRSSHSNSQPPVKELCFDSNATYLITGGFGGLGLETAGWLVEHGAKHIVLLGRRGPNSQAWTKIKALQENGVRIREEKVDVTDFNALSKSIAGVRESLPPLKGVFHLAGIAGEGVMINQDLRVAKEILSPKVEGAWNLHLITRKDSLDYFVLYSSISSLLKGHAVGAYSGANSFLDSLSHYRRRRGLPGISVNWGPFSQVGMVANVEKIAQLKEKIGLERFYPLKALANFIHVKELPQACIVDIDWTLFFTHSDMKNDPFLSLIKARHGGVELKKEDSNFLSELAAVSHEGRYELLVNYLIRKVSEVLGIDVNDISIHDNLLQMGMDSLIFLSLAETINNDAHVKIVPHKLFENPTIEGLHKQLSEEMTFEKTLPEKDGNTPFLIKHDSISRYEPFCLTDIQHAYWVGRSGVAELGNVACHAYFEIAAEKLDLDRYTAAWQKTIERHEMLRAIVLPDGRQQVLEGVPPFQIHTTDLRNESSDTIAQQQALIREQMSHQVRPADQWPLFEVRLTRIDDEQSLLHISIDLMIADGYSIVNLMQEILQYYESPELSLPPIACTFRDYVLAETNFRESELYQQSRQYWLERLPSLLPAPELPLAKTPSELETPRFVRREIRLGKDTWEKIQSYASKAGLTRVNVLLAAYAEVLAKWSKSQKFTLNLTFFHRMQSHPQINEVIGDFTSLILLQMNVSHDISFRERARQMQEQLWKDIEFRYFSGVRVLQELSRKNQGGERTLMPVIFTSNLGFDNIRQESTGLLFPGEVVYSISQTPQVWIDNQVSEDKDDLVIVWDAVEDLFPESVLDDMFNAYHLLLSRLSESEEAWHTNANLLPEYQFLQREGFNSTIQPLSSETLNSLFAKQAKTQAEQFAVVTSSVRISYKDLHHRSMAIASLLINHGVAPNTLIAVVMEKGWEQVVAVLGILEAGAAYLPIDPTVPEKRFSHLLNDGEVRLALTQSWLDQKLTWPEDIKVFFIDTQDYTQQHIASARITQSPDDLAYVIHTSGSTGLPKGVMIDHKGAVNTILDINKRFHVTQKDVVFALSNLNFDLSVYDIFGTLAAGGTIVMPDASETKNPSHWLDLINLEKVTIWNSVPMLMEMLLEHVSGNAVSIAESLRLCLLSGDWIPLELPEKIRVILKKALPVSLGGATEASIWSILYPIDKVNSEWKSIPYGRPMMNQQFYVLNENMEVCPNWVTGDLYIGGIGLAKGYWKDKEKTESSFIIHPETRHRLYRAGDLGRYLPDGNIDFLGREDFQVKVSGYRIELGEIEAVMKQHPGVKDSVVIVVDESDKKKFLVGYVVPIKNYDFSIEELMAYMKSQLPGYMVPVALKRLETLPLTPSGKINRKSLPIFDKANQRLRRSYVAPENELEEKIVRIVQEVLTIKKASTHDSFFNMGANSLDIIKIHNVLIKEMPQSISVLDFFEHSTIQDLAQYIINSRKTNKNSDSKSLKRANARKAATIKKKKR